MSAKTARKIAKKTAPKVTAPVVKTPVTNKPNRSNDLIKRDITDEAVRIVRVHDQVSGKRVPYEIPNPKSIFYYNGSSTMRILDSKGEVHLVPAPGYRGTVHSWIPRNIKDPVQF